MLMPLQYINIILKIVNMSDQLQMFEEHSYQKLTLSPLEALAKTLVSLEIVKGWEEIDRALSLKRLDSLMNADQEFLSGKMLKEHSAQTMAEILRQSSKPLPTLGVIDLNGNCVIHRGFYPKTERESTLSDILQTPQEIGKEFFLSKSAQARLKEYKKE